MKKMKIVNQIDEAATYINFALSNLDCVRISVKGNEDVMPLQETVDDAIFAVEKMIENQIKNIREAVDLLCELKIEENETTSIKGAV